MDDVLQDDVGGIEDLARTAGSSTDHDSLTGRLDAFGEDDPMAAALLRAQRANARHKARLNGRKDSGESAPELAPEEEPESHAAPLDGGSIQTDGEPPEEGGFLAKAFRQAKQANLSTQGRPLSLEKPEPGKDDTVSSLAASLQKSAEKASSRALKTKAAAGATRDERSASRPS